jgi:CBS domain-containing protein
MSPTSTPHAGATTAVRQVAHRDLATVEPDATLQDVAEELALDEIGVVLVQYVHDPIGLISERDLVAVLASGGDLERQATDLMTVDLVTVPEDTTIADVARLMLDARIRHVLVRDAGEGDDPDEGPVTGIVSMRDVVALLLDDVR